MLSTGQAGCQVLVLVPGDVVTDKDPSSLFTPRQNYLHYYIDTFLDDISAKGVFCDGKFNSIGF